MSLTQVKQSNIDESASQLYGMRNRIINGDMRIDQRGSASSPITSGSRAYAVDRWCCEKSGAGAFSLGQSSTAPTGFKYSLLATVTTADTSLASNDIYWFEHRVEGYSIADLEFGTANAKTITLSFWVRSSLTGTYSITLTSTGSKTFEYTINSANTWEYKTIQITGPTATHSPNVTNGTGFNFRFALAVGSSYAQAESSDWTSSDIIGSTNQVNWMATSGNTFYITGVQLEVGTVATPFENRQYGQELALCQRYYETTSYPNATQNITSTQTSIIWASSYATGQKYLVVKRAAPTITIYGRGGVAGSPTRTDTGEAITGTSTANNIGAVGYWGVAMGQGLAAYSTYALEVGYTASAEL
jgi:hypothetical protein